MEKRIHEAAEEGSVTSLLTLLQEDSLLLDRVTVNSYRETPLHIASMLGHEEFVQEILKRKPEIAREIDSQKSTSLHIASAKGYVNIVKSLVSVNPDMCFAVDRDGRNPLHIAATKGHVGVLRELVQARPAATRARMDKEETILHACVRYYQFEPLKYLVETMKDNEFLNSIDDDGNTILHLAVAIKHVKAVKYLTAGTAIEVNAFNANGFTALDILKQLQSKRNMKDWEIRESLQRAGAVSSTAKNIESSAHKQSLQLTGEISNTANNIESSEHKQSLQLAAALSSTAKDIESSAHIQSLQLARAISCTANDIELSAQKRDNRETGTLKDSHNHHEGDGDWLEQMRQALMVVASLIATMAFQAGVSPPTRADQPFLIFITTSFMASLSIVLLLISGLRFNRKAFMWFFMIILWVAITTLAIAFLISLSVLSDYDSTPTIGLLIWLGLVAILLLVHAIRLTRKAIRHTRTAICPKMRIICFIKTLIHVIEVLKKCVVMKREISPRSLNA